MNDVKIFEQRLEVNGQPKGMIAILMGGLSSDNPTVTMDRAVAEYVGETPYNEFVEVFLDNPWVRVIISGIDDLAYHNFEKQRLNGQGL